MTEDPTTYAIIGAAMAVHRQVGPGLLESAYQACLEEELRHQGIPFVRERPIHLAYRSIQVRNAYRVDFVVAGRVVVEVKAIAEIAPIHEAQLLTYLRLTGLRTGLLINFHAPRLRDGIRRRVL